MIGNVFTSRGTRIEQLGNVSTFLGGGTPSKRNPTYWDGDIPWVSPKDMKSEVVSTSIDKITSEAIEGSAAKKIPVNSLLVVVRSGILARTVPIGIAGTELTINQDLKAIVPARSIDYRYLSYFLRASEPELLASVSKGATVHRLPTDSLKSLSIPVPPLDAQKRIVTVLDQAFAALDRARAHAEANLADAVELLAQATRHELDDEQLGNREPLGNHVDLLTGFAFKSKGYSENPADIRLIRGDNLVQGCFRWEGVKRWPISERDKYSKYELAEKDVLIAMDRTWVAAGIKYAVVEADALPSLLVQRVARIRTHQSLSARYLAHWIGSKMFEEYVLSIQTGLGVPHVSGKQIEAFPIRVPSLAAQESRARALDAISKKCSGIRKTYSDQLSDLRKLRQSFLQKAFSGQLT